MKVRVWNHETQTMISLWDGRMFCLFGDGLWDIIQGNKQDVQYASAGDSVLMEYIDFHDKHGKQGAQGDILELNCLGWGETYKAKAVIEYRDFQWWFHMIDKPEGVEWNPIEKKWEPESEIIGNIYEHAHLLEREVSNE